MRILVGVILAWLVLLCAAVVFPDDADRYRRAAEQGDVEAQYRLGNAYYYGTGVPTNIGEAVKWYRMAAEQGHVVAQNRLGASYLHGLHGVSQDHTEAAKWFHMAAEQGDRTRDTSLAEFMPTDGACHRTIPKLRSGIVWPRNKGMETHNTPLVKCINLVMTCLKTMPKQRGGIAWPQKMRTGVHLDLELQEERNTNLASCTLRAA